MKKLLAVLASLSLTSALSSAVISCGDKEEPEFAEDKEIFSVEPQNEKLEIDNDGNQVEDFNFNLNYVLASPTTGDTTNVQIQSADIAADEENPSDDTRRHGEFFSIEKIETSENVDEPQVHYCLKFTGEPSEYQGGSMPGFNLAINFKGTYFADEEFSVTLYFKFDLINNYRSDVKKDLKNYINEEERNLGVIEDVNAVIEDSKAEEIIKVAVYKRFRELVNHVDMEFDLPSKEVKVIADLNSEEFKGDVTLKFLHGDNPVLLPDVTQGIDLPALATDRLAFSKLNLDAKMQLILDPLKQWYALEKGQEYTNLYFQYFKVDETEIDFDDTEVLIKFESPWPDLDQDFEARIVIPYTPMEDKLPADLFAEKLLDMNPTTMDELVLSKLSEKANQKLPDFDDLFEFGALDVAKQTIEIVAKTKETGQIYEPQAKLTLNFNVKKINIEELLGAKLKDYSFDATLYDIYYLIIKELGLGRIRTGLNTKLTAEERTMITLDNEFNDKNFDTTDPDKWKLQITPSKDAERYMTGELYFQYRNPKKSSYTAIRNWDYDIPGRYQTFQLDTPFLVSTQEEVQTGFIKTLRRVCAANPFAKWLVFYNVKDVDVKIPDRVLNYDLTAHEKVKQYMTGGPSTKINFKLASLDLETYFYGGINIGTPLESITPSTIAEELYQMIIGTKESDFKSIPNFKDVVEVIDVIVDSGTKTGTAVLRVKDTYTYKDYVLNTAKISFTLK